MQFQVVQQLVCTHWEGLDLLQHPHGMHSCFATSVVPTPPRSIPTVTCSDADGDIGTMSAIAEPACAKAKNNRATTMEAIFLLRAMV
jgi:hypothetical protein